MEIVWKDPPATNNNLAARKELVEFANKLRANPGHWAQYPRVITTNMTTYINRGHSKTWQPAGAFEATQTTVKGERLLFVRYVGEDLK